jgi:predicted secreted hydrolase
MTEQTLLQDVCARLQANGLTVSIEYPGCVVVWAEDLVSHPDRCWWFGTANETWQGDLCGHGGEYLDQTLRTDVPSDSTDAERIARAIREVLEHPTAATRHE